MACRVSSGAWPITPELGPNADRAVPSTTAIMYGLRIRRFGEGADSAIFGSRLLYERDIPTRLLYGQSRSAFSPLFFDPIKPPPKEVAPQRFPADPTTGERHRTCSLATLRANRPHGRTG